MSATKEFLTMCAAQAGYGDNVGAYLSQLAKVRQMDKDFDMEMERRDKEEKTFWASVEDGSYWKEMK